MCSLILAHYCAWGGGGTLPLKKWHISGLFSVEQKSTNFLMDFSFIIRRFFQRKSMKIHLTHGDLFGNVGNQITRYMDKIINNRIVKVQFKSSQLEGLDFSHCWKFGFQLGEKSCIVWSPPKCLYCPTPLRTCKLNSTLFGGSRS